jgi:hypothetical protein
MVRDFCHLSDLLHTRAFREAGTELSEMEGDTESLGVFNALSQTVLVPFIALVSLVGPGFTSGAHGRRELAAVGVVVQNVVW